MKKRVLAAALTMAIVLADVTTIGYAAEPETDTEMQAEAVVESETETPETVLPETETEEAPAETETAAETEAAVPETDAADEVETIPETEDAAPAEDETEVETEAETEAESEEEAVLLDADIAKNIAYCAWMNAQSIEIFTQPLGKDASYHYVLYDAAAEEAAARAAEADPESSGADSALLGEGTLTAQKMAGDVHYLKIDLGDRTYPEEVHLALTSGTSGTLDIFLMKSAAPSQVSAQAVGTTGLKLAWTGSLGKAAGWKVQLFEQDKTNKASASVTVKGTSAELKNLKAGTLYKAVISPYKEIKDASGKVVRVYDGAKASMFNLNTQAPSLKAANSNLAITISWDRIAGAGSYDVYRSLKGKNSFSKVKSVTGTSYKDSNLKDNTAYDYKVQVMGSAYKGATSGVISRTALANPGKPSNLKAKKGECQAKLTWKKVKGASGYAVFYYDTGKNAVGSQIGTTSGTSYTVKGLQGGKTFTFVVKAYKKAGDGSVVYGNPSNTAKAKPTFTAPGAVKGAKAAGDDHAVKLTWKEAKKATGYNIYEYNTSTGKVGAKVGSTKNTSFTAGDLEPGKTYAFVVYAYRTVNGYTGQGKRSDPVSAKALNLIPGAASGLKAAGSDKEVILTWTAAKNAQSYTIFQKNTETGEYKSIGSTKNTSYTVPNLVNKTSYTFRIQPYRKWGVKEVHTVYGPYSGDVTATPKFSGKVPAPSALNVTNSKSGNKLNWTAVKYATGYIIYRYNYSKSKYEKVAEVGAVTTWNDASIKTTKGKFKYKVCAYRIEEGKTYNGSGIEKVAFGASDIDTVTNKIHAIYYNARINQSTRLFDKNDVRIGNIKPGERVVYQYRRPGRCKIKRANGDVVYIKTSALTYTSEIYTSKDYGTDEKELFVNYKGYSSKTNYLIWISTYSQHVNIFTGSKGKWKLFRSCLCATGAIETPTPLGGYTLYAKQSAQKYRHTYYRYLSKFRSKNSMHTRIRYYSGRIQDKRLGRPLSHGCIRMEDENAKYIYKNVPKGTTVIAY